VAATIAHLAATCAVSTLAGNAFLVLVCTQSMNDRCEKREAKETCFALFYLLSNILYCYVTFSLRGCRNVKR
jgi:hypothetical protein